MDVKQNTLKKTKLWQHFYHSGKTVAKLLQNVCRMFVELLNAADMSHGGTKAVDEEFSGTLTRRAHTHTEL